LNFIITKKKKKTLTIWNKEGEEDMVIKGILSKTTGKKKEINNFQLINI
jgi:hypothetical protein